MDSPPMRKGFLEALRQRPGLLLIFIPLIALNGWFDYYHPIGIVFDVVIVIALIGVSEKGKN